MAKLQKKKGAADQAASDLEILHPEVRVDIGGETVTVRELSFVEEIENSWILTGIAQEIEQINRQPGDPGYTNQLLDILSSQGENLLHLLSISCDRPLDWFRKLPPGWGEQLMMHWWGVNRGFFTRRAMRMELEKMEKASLGLNSLPPSSQPGTTPNGSSTTPPGSSGSTTGKSPG